MKRIEFKENKSELTCSEFLLTALKLHENDVLLLLRFRSLFKNVTQVLERYQSDKDVKKLLNAIKIEIDK